MAAYRLSVRFIPLDRADRTVVARIDEGWCRSRLAEVSAIFEPTGVEFAFGALDPPHFDDRLNLDVPPGADAGGIETARQRHAERFQGELVVFVRHFFAEDSRYKAFHYSSVEGDFVVAEPGSSEWGLAHEFGHFFGLPHTHDDDLLDKLTAVATVPERVAILAKLLGDAIASRQVAQHEALTLLDGDRAIIGDTRADVAPPLFQPNNRAGEESGPGSPDAVTIPVVVRRGNTATTTIPFSLRPDKLNLMSYFTPTRRPHLSGEQSAAVQAIVHSGKRRRLIQGRWTNWIPRDAGVLTGAPSTICRQPGLVELFGRGLDGRTWQNTFADGAWLGWFSHGDGFAVGATPTVGSMSPDHLLLLACDTGGEVYAKWWLDGVGAWNQWERLGAATLKGSPSIICRRPGLVELFGRGLDDRTWQNTFVDGKWLGWFRHDDNFPVGASPTVGSMSPDHLLLVTTDSRGAVQAKWWLDKSGAWTDWQPLGSAVLKGSASILCRRPGLVEVFGRGLDDRTWQNTFVDGKWLGWFDHGDDFPIAATPTASSMSADHLQLFVTAPNGTVWQKWWYD